MSGKPKKSKRVAGQQSHAVFFVEEEQHEEVLLRFHFVHGVSGKPKKSKRVTGQQSHAVSLLKKTSMNEVLLRLHLCVRTHAHTHHKHTPNRRSTGTPSLAAV